MWEKIAEIMYIHHYIDIKLKLYCVRNMITVLFHIYLFLEIMTEMQVKIIIIWRSLLISKGDD